MGNQDWTIVVINISLETMMTCYYLMLLLLVVYLGVIRCLLIIILGLEINLRDRRRLNIEIVVVHILNSNKYKMNSFY